MSYLSPTTAENAQFTPAAHEESLPLPPAPSLSMLLKHGPRLLRGSDVEKAFADFFDAHGPVVRLDFRANKFIDGLLKLLGKRESAPYIIMRGAEGNRFLTTSNPALVQRGPIASDDFVSIASIDGEQQMRHRKLVMHGFRTEKLAGYIPMTVKVVERRLVGWGARVNLFDEMKDLALEIIAYNMLGVEPRSAEYAEFAGAYWTLIFGERGGRESPEYRHAKERMWAFLRALITRRRSRPGDDALSAMLAACDAEGAPPVDEEVLTNYAYMLTEFGQSDIAIFLTYLVAVLTLRPDLLKRALEERSLYSEEAALDLEHRLPFTLNVMREVERLYSPVTSLFRSAAADIAFGRYRIPKGALLISSVYLTHRLPSLFANPLEFDPDRFAPPRQEHKRPHALMGFGGGYHRCVASVYSRVQACVILHTLLSRFRLAKVGAQELPPINYRGAIQRPLTEILLKVAPAR